MRDTNVTSVAHWVILAAASGNVVIALGAFWLSFTALTNLASKSGIPTAEAWVWPLIVDGMIVVATISVVALSPYGRRAIVYPWGLLIAGTAASVAANIAHSWIAADVTVSKPLAACVSAIPPIVLLASTHLTVDLTRRSRVQASVSPIARENDAAAERQRPSADTTVAVTDLRSAAAELRGVGLSNRRIARELGVHPSTVGRWLPSGLENVGGSDTSVDVEEQGPPSA